jgi:hypothetical protein
LYGPFDARRAAEADPESTVPNGTTHFLFSEGELLEKLAASREGGSEAALRAEGKAEADQAAVGEEPMKLENMNLTYEGLILRHGEIGPLQG